MPAERVAYNFPYHQYTLAGADPNVAIPASGFPIGSILYVVDSGRWYGAARSPVGVSTWQPLSAATAFPAAISYTFAGGALDYTALPDYNPAGATQLDETTSGLLGDGTSVPRFNAYGLGFITALARTTQPSLRLTLAALNGEGLLSAGSTTEQGANLVLPLPVGYTANGNFQIDATVATNMPTIGLATILNDVVSMRFGLLRWTVADAIPSTICRQDIYSAGPLAGVMTETCRVSTQDGANVTLTGETSGGVNERRVRITVEGARIRMATASSAGAYTTRVDVLQLQRVGVPQNFALCFTLWQSQVAAGAQAGYWADLRALSLTPL